MNIARKKLLCFNSIVLPIGLLLTLSCQVLRTLPSSEKYYDVIVVGGGASGISAGIQSARLGARTLVIESTPWLGGMITAAGVSAFDGNHEIAGGIFKEFRDSLYAHYGGSDKVSTGWVSNTLFEPHVGNRIFKNIAGGTPGLDILFNTHLRKSGFSNNLWNISAENTSGTFSFTSKVLIDATELGDIAAAHGIKYDIGMDSGSETGEWFAPDKANDIVQDLTYVMILKDYGTDVDRTIVRPLNYDPSEFDCCCDTKDPSRIGPPLIDCDKMMEYGRLPNNKFMINWPNCGNDIYMNIISLDEVEREKKLQEAKDISFRFLYYLQHELGYKNLDLADDEYDTADKLPYIPYHRESRRIKGQSRLLVQHITHPYDQAQAYYRTGIAVGNYPIDHHHKKNPETPNIDFINIKAPAFNIPMGSLLPSDHEHLIVAEKSISVSNIVNGSTRLQPVVLAIGQAAGTIAAISISRNTPPSRVPIRHVQNELIKGNVYIMPYKDVNISDPDFAIIQRIGATGVLKGAGIPYLWANEMWFYPENEVTEYELVQGLRELYPMLNQRWDASGSKLKLAYFAKVLNAIDSKITEDSILGILALDRQETLNRRLNRRQVARVLDTLLKPFEIDVNHDGQFVGVNKEGDQSAIALQSNTDSVRFYSAPWVVEPLSEGIEHRHYHFNNKELFNTNQNIHILHVNKKSARTRFKIVSAFGELVKTSKLANDAGALAAVNGGFFDMRQGGSVNYLRVDNELITDPQQGDTPKYGAHQDGVVAFDKERFDLLKRDRSKGKTWEAQLDYANILESGPMLIESGHNIALPNNPFNDNRHPRTAVCVTDEGVILLTADGRNANAQGLSLPELTQILSWLNCKDALNLDGGGSTTFYLQNKGVVNMPCDNRQWDHQGERPVSNILMVEER